MERAAATRLSRVGATVSMRRLDLAVRPCEIVGPMIELTDVVREKVLAVGAVAWLDALPDLVRDLEREWDITVGRPFRGGTEAYVAEERAVRGPVRRGSMAASGRATLVTTS
jgi:hypothetical protein